MKSTLTFLFAIALLFNLNDASAASKKGKKKARSAKSALVKKNKSKSKKVVKHTKKHDSSVAEEE